MRIILVASLLFFSFSTSVFASTVWSSGASYGEVTLQQTGTCCSFGDNYRFWNQFYPDVPAVSFDNIRFLASTTASTLQVYVYVYTDNGDLVDNISDGFSSATPWSGDTLVSDFSVTATKTGNLFTATLPSSVTVQSGQYLWLSFTQLGTTPEFIMPTSNGAAMFRTVESSSPAPYEFVTERVKIDLCTGVCDDWVDGGTGVFPTYTFPTLQSLYSYDTRFLSLAMTEIGTSKDFNLALSYYLDPDEIEYTDPLKSPTHVKFTFVRKDNGDTDFVYFPIATTTGTSSVNLTLDFAFPTGIRDYNAVMSFANLASILGGSAPFPLSTIVLQFSINAQHLTSVSTPAYYDNVFTSTPITFDAIGSCGLDNLSACILAPIVYLFTPSDGAISGMLEIMQSSDNPLLANAILAFNAVSSASQASPDGHALAYTLEIPQAGIDVPMLSVDSITYLFGDSLPIFRSIMILSIWLGFLAMVLSSIWSRVNGTPDPVQGIVGSEESVFRRSGTSRF